MRLILHRWSKTWNETRHWSEILHSLIFSDLLISGDMRFVLIALLLVSTVGRKHPSSFRLKAIRITVTDPTGSACCHGQIFSQFLPPQTKFRAIIFLHFSVILFTGGKYLGKYPPGKYTPHGLVPLPGQVPPRAGNPPQAGTPRQVHPRAGTPLQAVTP